MMEGMGKRIDGEILSVFKGLVQPWFFGFALAPIGVGSFLGAGNFRLAPVILLILAVFAGEFALAALIAYRRNVMGEPVRTSAYFFPGLRWPFEFEPLLPLACSAAVLAAIFGVILCFVSGWGMLLPGFLAFLSLYLFAFGKAYQVPGLGLVLVAFVEGISLALAAFYAQTGYFSMPGFLGALPVGLILAAFLLTDEIRERDTDLSKGDMSFPNQWGAAFGYRLFYIFFVLAYLFLILNILYGVTDLWPAFVFLTIPGARRLLSVAALGKAGDSAAEAQMEAEMVKFYPQFAFAYVFTLLLAFAL